MNHFYVYEYVEKPSGGGKPYYFYERTCGSERGAQDRVDELKKRGRKAVFLVNHTIRNAFY